MDAAEGPLPQTKFVVSKALKVGLKPIVVINKVDRPDARPTVGRERSVRSLRRARCQRGAARFSDPLRLRQARLDGGLPRRSEGRGHGAAVRSGDSAREGTDAVEEGPFRLLGTILEANPYLGRIVTGRISSGTVKPNQPVKVLDRTGRLIEQGRLTKVLAFRGLERTGVEEASAGDIVAIAGLPGRDGVAHHLRIRR